MIDADFNEKDSHPQCINNSLLFQLNQAEQFVPHLEWANALVVPWNECVRDPEKQPTPFSEHQQIYFRNNQVLRVRFLKMLTDIFLGKITDLDDFSKSFANLHKILIIGEDGTNIYMSPDQQRKIGSHSPYDIAGNFGEDKDGWNKKLCDLFERLRKFIDPANITSHSKLELIQQVGHIFFYNLNGFPEEFAYGNNALNMNIINGLLRLLGLKGIPHSWLDINFVCRRNEPNFPAEFMAMVKKMNPDISL